MSFCGDIKNELAVLKVPDCCQLPLSYGLMLFGRAFSARRIALQTENREVAELYSRLLKDLFGVTVQTAVGGSSRPTYRAEVANEADRLKILASFDFGVAESIIPRDILTRDCCRQSFIRGAFLAAGSISDPEKEYRAEFVVKTAGAAEEFSALLSEYGINLKNTARGSSRVLYVRESNAVEDLLTVMGLSNRTLDIMDKRIIKSVKNNSNRRSNCDSGNISKTVEASLRQRRAIAYLEEKELLQSLPPELSAVAILRRDNPDLTLKELCRISPEPITPSGLNHRLAKIVAFYEEVRSHRG